MAGVRVMPSEDIGGGVVRRLFRAGEVTYHVSTRLPGALIQGWRNHRALIGQGFIDVWPRADLAGGTEEAATAGSPPSRVVVNIGFGKFDVIEGRKLNDKPLNKEEATALAKRAGEGKEQKH